MSDILPDRTMPLTEDEQIDLACDWSDYRKGYGISNDPAVSSREHLAFKAGWKARRDARNATLAREASALAPVFRSAWHKADREGRAGERVTDGLTAVLGRLRAECGAPHPYAGPPCARPAEHSGSHGAAERAWLATEDPQPVVHGITQTRRTTPWKDITP